MYLYFLQGQSTRKKEERSITLTNSNRNLIVAGFLIILGLLIIISPWYILPICEAKPGGMSGDMQEGSMNMEEESSSHMSCWYTARAEIGVGALIIVSGLTLISLPGRNSRKAVGIQAIGLGIFAILLPTLFTGICPPATAPCRIGTQPSLIIFGVLTIATGLYLFFSRDNAEKVLD